MVLGPHIVPVLKKLTQIINLFRYYDKKNLNVLTSAVNIVLQSSRKAFLNANKLSTQFERLTNTVALSKY